VHCVWLHAVAVINFLLHLSCCLYTRTVQRVVNSENALLTVELFITILACCMFVLCFRVIFIALLLSLEMYFSVRCRYCVYTVVQNSTPPSFKDWPFWDLPAGPKMLLWLVLVVVVVVVISSLKVPKAFLTRSAVQRNFAYTFVLIYATDPLSQILK